VKWAILCALVFLSPAAMAGERETKPTECSVIESKAFGFVKCNYRPNSRQWRLVYLPTAYGQVLKSGNYRAMLSTLCDAYGESIHETIHEIFKGASRELSCALSDKSLKFER
jgi:hypothetical protein